MVCPGTAGERMAAILTRDRRSAREVAGDRGRRVAPDEAIAHLRGRPRALGGGHLLVQALAGLSRAREGAEHFEEAMRLFDGRQGFDLSYLWVCSDEVTLFELSRAAAALGRAGN